jgi:hypothetical protein
VADLDSVEVYVTDAIKKGVALTGLGQLVVLFYTKELRLEL